MANKTTLRTKKTNEILYPQTLAEIVSTTDGGNVEQKLQNIENKLSEVEQAKDYKGYFPNVDVLLAKYPNGNHPERAGWYARVGDAGTSDTTMYYWDLEDDAWVKGAIVNLTGATSVNGVEPDSEGNVTLTATNIPTAFTTAQGTKKSTQEVFNDLQSEHNQLEDEIELLQNKTNVLYLTNAQFADALNRLVEPYANGQVAVANDDGDYKIGSSYKFVISGTEEEPVYTWEEITSSGGTEITDTLTLSKEVVIPELIGSVEYDTNYTYSFTDSEDGYWVNDNGSKTYSASLLKLKFNFNNETNLIFDFTQTSTPNNYLAYCFGLFGNVDAEIPDSYSDKTTGVYESLVSQKEGQVIYENFPAGEHFIMVKFVKSGYGGTQQLKFKLASPLNKDEERYQSTGSITIGDNNNLQINHSDILTKQTVTHAIIEIKGTKKNPINLEELTPGKWYKLSGNFVWDTASKGYVHSILSELSTLGNEDPSVIVLPNGEDENFGMGYFILGGGPTTTSLSSSDIRQGGGYYSSGSKSASLISVRSNNLSSADLVLKNLAKSYDGNYFTYLATDNNKEYTPRGDFNPATKKFVEDAIFDNPPISKISIDDISTSSVELNSRFATINDQNNKQLYYYKTDGIEYEMLPAARNESLDTTQPLALDKTIVNSTDSSTFTGLNFHMRKYSDETNYTTEYITLYIIPNINLSPKTIQLYSSKNTSNKITLYDGNTGWVDDGYNRSNFFALSNFVRNNLNLLIPNPEAYAKLEVNEVYWTVGSTYQSELYVKKLIEVPSGTPVRIALYEDLANAGGGSSGEGTAEIPAEVVKYYEEYDSTKTYKKNDMVYYANHFFISVSDNNTGNTPNINMFYTMSGNNLYWRNMGYSATYAGNATNDGDGNNISNTYATKQEVMDVDGEVATLETTVNTELGAGINLTIDNSTFVVTAQLVNKNGTIIGTPKTIDLPLETMVVNAEYIDSTKTIKLTLKNGTTTEFSVADLVGGLVPDTRTINGQALSSNVTLTAEDIQYFKDSPETITQAFEILLTQFAESLDEIRGYTVNGKSIDTNPVLNASNISATIDGTDKTVQATLTDIKQDVATVAGSTINGKVISTNPTLTASDISTTIGSGESVQGVLDEFELGLVTLFEATVNGKNVAENPVLTAEDVGAVPTSRTINSKPLTSNITLTPSDIGAVASSAVGTAAYKTATNSFVTGDTQDEYVPTVHAVRAYLTAQDYVNSSDLGTASAKNYTTSVTDSADLPTASAVKTFVENKGYALYNDVPAFVLNGTTLIITPR